MWARCPRDILRLIGGLVLASKTESCWEDVYRAAAPLRAEKRRKTETPPPM